MVESAKHDVWGAGDSYEAYMGRWSRQVANEFIQWLDMPDSLDWLELGCGTGALGSEILSQSSPNSIICTDSAPGFVEAAKQRVNSTLAEFEIASAEDIPLPDRSRDCVVSGLALNFISDKPKALSEMKRVLKPEGTIAFYVWDYPGRGVGFMKEFWTAAISCDPTASQYTENKRFDYCTEQGLTELTEAAGFIDVRSRSIELISNFSDFDDLWHPFTLGAGPAPGYCANLTVEKREELRTTLENQLETKTNGSISLPLRAWAVRASN